MSVHAISFKSEVPENGAPTCKDELFKRKYELKVALSGSFQIISTAQAVRFRLLDYYFHLSDFSCLEAGFENFRNYSINRSLFSISALAFSGVFFGRKGIYNNRVCRNWRMPVNVLFYFIHFAGNYVHQLPFDQCSGIYGGANAF
jgi:hypothetical protein